MSNVKTSVDVHSLKGIPLMTTDVLEFRLTDIFHQAISSIQNNQNNDSVNNVFCPPFISLVSL